jgi:hypothetical protein
MSRRAKGASSFLFFITRSLSSEAMLVAVAFVAYR